MPIKRDSIKLVNEFLSDGKGEYVGIRSVLIFGKNTSTYKFAFCHSILQQKPSDFLKYEDIKADMLNIFIERYKIEKKQFTSGESQFTKSLDQYLSGDLTKDYLEAEADKVLLKYVIDAFQTVGGASLAREHLLFEHDKKSKRIVLTDKFNHLLDSHEDRMKLLEECNNRWSIVEEAWENDISPNLIYDKNSGGFIDSGDVRRVAVRSALSALLPYQKGGCFYCNRLLDLKVTKDQDSFPDVDHFIPWTFLKDSNQFNVNGVWNLVISCMKCNRGRDGKRSQIPDTVFFEKLLTRNLYFSIEHKHSLKTSVLKSLGISDPDKIPAVMRNIYNLFPFTKWKPTLL